MSTLIQAAVFFEVERYNFKSIENKWQKTWEQKKVFSVQVDKNKKKFYCLEMFPYPSGKIHMGHVRNYTIGDVLARFKKLQDFNVLHPMGWDSFGMPAENAARQNNLSPKDWTESNISNMKSQLKRLGLSIDWDREISTCSVDYYKHQQEFFLELYDKGLVYRKEQDVNWDPVDQTVLANEQVIDGKGWRSGAQVERKKLNQWFFNITKFSNELLDSLENLKDWPEKVSRGDRRCGPLPMETKRRVARPLSQNQRRDHPKIQGRQGDDFPERRLAENHTGAGFHVPRHPHGRLLDAWPVRQTAARLLLGERSWP